MAIARGISETSIVFDGNNGHNHDGTAENGSLIDTSKYSIYDFSPTKINTADNQRSIRQDNNINAFNNKVAEIVNNLVLRPAGIVLQEETLNGNYIIANTITSNQIAADSITANEIAANTITTNELTSDILQSSNYSYTSGTFSNAGTFFDLADGSITSRNFAIDNSGNAYFTGQINATSGTFSGNITSSATISGGTLTGATITGSTLTAGDTAGDGVSITGTRVLINTTGGTGSGAARLKFNTNSGSGDNFIESDKRLVLTAGGGGETKILVGLQNGSAVGPMAVTATDITLNGTSVSLSNHTHAYAPTSHTHDYAASSHSHDYASTSHTHNYASTSHTHDYAASDHSHSTYSTTSHLHDSRYSLNTHGHNYLSTISGGTVNGAVNFTTNSFRLSGLSSLSLSTELRISSAGYLYRFSSLRKLKKDIYSSRGVLEYINEKNPIYYLNPVIFKPIEDIEKEDSYLHGFIAEEVAEVMPEMATLDENGDLTVYKASTITPLLVAEIQRLGEMVNELYSIAFPDWQPPAERSDASKIESRKNMERYSVFIKNGGLNDLEL